MSGQGARFASILDLEALWKTVVAAVVGVGLTTSYAFAVRGAARSSPSASSRARVPTVFVMNYVHARDDLEFYDGFFEAVRLSADALRAHAALARAAA